MLRDLQKAFLEGIFTLDTPSAVLDQIQPSLKLAAADHLEIYRGSIFGTLTKALAETYPVCRQLVGDLCFDQITTLFIQKFPSVSPDLYEYGEEFPTFLASLDPLQSLPYLPDVARLEWVWQSVFHYAKPVGFDLQTLSTLTRSLARNHFPTACCECLIRLCLPDPSYLENASA
jgi:hypothetical protein